MSSQSNQAEELIKRVLDHQVRNCIKSDFSYTFLNPNLDSPIKKSGTAVFNNEKYAVTLGDEKYLSDGKLVWNINHKQKELSIDCVDEISSVSIYQKLKEQNVAWMMAGEDGGLTKIRAVYKDDDSRILTAYFWINSKSLVIEKYLAEGKDGSSGEFRLSNISIESNCNDDQFKLDTQDYFDDTRWVVIDMREFCE